MRQVFGGLFLGCGILVAALSGLCTVIVAGTSMFDPGSAGDMMTIIPAVLIFGGFPFICGLGLFFAGRSLLRDRAGAGYVPPPAPPAAPLDPATMAHPKQDGEGTRP
jgi:hypothetical protein